MVVSVASAGAPAAPAPPKEPAGAAAPKGGATTGDAGRVFRFVIPGSRHTLAMGMDHLSEDLVGTLLGAVGGLGFGFVGEDVNSEELSTWALGGMNETGLDPSGRAWSAYAWVRTLLSDPVNTPDVLQLE